MIEKEKNKKAFSLVELLLAIGIFAVIVSANLVLSLDAYRSRANDKIRVSAGLVVKDTINGLYAYKNDYWSEVIKNIDGQPRRLDLVNSKFQINHGGFSIENVNYQIIFEKAQRAENGNIVPNNSGNDPDTIKVTVSANWKDILGSEQTISESYFLTNWDSMAWIETDKDDFEDYEDDIFGQPVNNGTQVNEADISLAVKPVIASDWCQVNLSDPNQSAEGYNVTNEANGVVYGVSAPNTSSVVDYVVIEPEIESIPPVPATPSNPNIEAIQHTPVCEDDSSVMNDEQCEVLVKLYYSTDGDSWSNKGSDEAQWLNSTNPCNWYGVTCSGGNVTSLSLPNNNLTGVLLPELGVLEELTTLNFSQNSLTGVIPKTIGNLDNLESLDLSEQSGDGLMGMIPAEISAMSSLEYLYLQNNSLTCHLPAELVNMSVLNTANFSGNNLLPATNGDVVAFLTSKSAPVIEANQDEVIEHEDCIYAPEYSDSVLLVQDDNSSELTINNSEFPLDVSAVEFEDAPWNDSEFISHSYLFDGNDVVEIPYSKEWNLTTGDYTVSIWFKSDGAQTGTSRLLDFHDAGEGWYLNMNTNSTLTFFYESDDNDVNLQSPAVTHNTWHHVAVVMDNGTATMYIDGLSEDIDAYSVLVNISDDTTPLFVGNNDSTDGFSGLIDEVRIYERALPSLEVEQTRLIQTDKKDPGLLGYWRFDEDEALVSSAAMDASYQQVHGGYGYSTNGFGILCLENGFNQNTPCTSSDSPVRYRINDVAQYGNMVYLTTSYHSMDLIYFDKTEGSINYQVVDLSGKIGDSYSIFATDSSVFVSKGSYIYQFERDNMGTYRSKDMKIGCDPLIGDPCEVNNAMNNVTDITVNGDLLYAVSMDEDYNLGILNISSETFTYEDLELRNLYLDVLW